MAKLVQDQHYVNFLRGTPAAWERLEVKDPDTLYFISERNGEVGQLYLGEKLIVGSLNATTLESLGGIPTEDLESGQLLVYNAEEQKWENKSFSELLAPLVKVMTGATFKTAGVAGLAPAPAAGDQDKFLKGDGTWDNYQLTEEEITKVLDRVEFYWDNF